jgi:hypothetical protein
MLPNTLHSFLFEVDGGQLWDTCWWFRLGAIQLHRLGCLYSIELL